MSCPAGKQYYVCYKGNFRGCCSTDPCTYGTCPDGDGDGDGEETGDGDADDATITTVVVTSTDLPSTSSLDSSSPATIQSTSTLATSTSLTTATPATSQATSTSTSTPTPGANSGSGSNSDSNSNSGSSNSALIGGVVGGVVAALLILGIVLCLFYRRRKKQGKRFTLLRGSPRDDERGEYGGQVDSMRGVGNETGGDNNNNHRSTPSTTFTSPGKPLSTQSSSPGTSFTTSNRDSNTTSTSTAYQPLPPIPPSSELLAPVAGHGHGQNRTALTPELGDTGFYRQRAELASTSQSELINIPPEQRKNTQTTTTSNPNPNTKAAMNTNNNKETLKPSPNLGGGAVSPARSDVSSLTPSPGTSPDPHGVKRQTPPVVTGDGVVLRPNLDQQQTSKRRTGDGHVMSFMQYDSGSENGSSHGSGHGSGEKEGGLGLGLGLKGAGIESRSQK